MEKQKINLILIFGGMSPEHEISIISARNIFEAIDKEKYQVVLLGVSKSGKWYEIINESYFKEVKSINYRNNYLKPIVLVPEKNKPAYILSLDNLQTKKQIDVVFPIIHGPYGEDGSLQGLLKMYQIPFVGCEILGSAICMDKEVMKRLFIEAGIPTAKHILLRKEKKNEINIDNIVNTLSLPFFIKPANMGSSVGVHKINSIEEFRKKTEDAFLYDDKVIAEKYIKGKEIECAVLGNQNPQVSICGEINPIHDFYSYEAKYLDDKGAELVIPANIDKNIEKQIQDNAIKAYLTLECKGMARVDFFVSDENEIYINEINTHPGFTQISMYPKLWDSSGIKYSNLISKLVDLAFEREKDIKLLKLQFDIKKD